MTSVWLLAGLTWREMLRRRLFVLSLLIALLFFLASLMPTLFGARDVTIRATGQQQSVAVVLAAFLGVPMLKFFAALQVIGLASGAVSGDLERGLLAVVLPKPIARWQVIVGKWIGINLVLVANLLLWTTLGWASLRLQTGHSFPTLFLAGAWSVVYSLIFCTLALFFSTFTTGALAAGLAALLGAAAWPHAILRQLGSTFHVPALARAGAAARYLVPVNQVELWVEHSLGPIAPSLINPAGFAFNVPRQPSAADLVYVGLYIAALFAAALVIFQRRDIH
jgi:ABC-type transport system involved in multi-copper enzyme maturation permease subunit